MCQLVLGSVAWMRIKALDLLDSPPPNRDDEIDEISVPFGQAPAEQIVRPERTNIQSRVQCNAADTDLHSRKMEYRSRVCRIPVRASEALSSPSWFKQYQSEKMTRRSLNKENKIFFLPFVCKSSSGQ